MAHSVRRVPVLDAGPGLGEGGALRHLWRQWNRFVGFFDGHTHTGTTNGAANTAGAVFPAAAVAKIGVKKGRAETLVSPAADTTPVTATGNVGVVAVDTPFGTTLAANEVGLLEAIVHAMNVAAAELEGHIHGGATSGASNTNAPGGAAGSTAPGILTDVTGRTPAGVLNPASPFGHVRVPFLPTRREGLLAEAILMLDSMIFEMDSHVHGGVGAGPNVTGGFTFTSAVQAIADINGRGPDGEVVT